MFAAAMPNPSPAYPALPQFHEALELTGAVRAVVAAVLRLSPKHPDVEDCTSETLRRAVEHRSRLRPGEPVRPWLLGIARHVALDLIRERKRRPALPSSGAADGAEDATSPLERIPDPSPGPAEQFELRRERAELTKALATLPEGVAAVLVAFHVEGKSYQTIADEMNLPLGTVATWVNRGRKALAERLRAGEGRS